MNGSAALIPTLLVVFPLAMAGGCLVLRRAPRAVLAAGLAAIAVEALLALSAPVEQPARLLELGVTYDQLGRLLLAAACAGAFTATLAAAAGKPGEHFVATELLILSCTAAIAVVQEPLVVAGSLLLSGLVGAVQLVDRPAGSAALLRPRTLAIAVRYTVVIALGGLCTMLGFTLLTGYAERLATDGPALQRVALGMLVAGYAVRAGLIPFHLWLPGIVEDAAPSTAAIHAGLLTILSLPVLVMALETQPELLVGDPSGERLLLGLGAISALGGGAIGLLGGGTRRNLAYLAVANLGLLTIGIGTGSVPGIEAALLGAFGHIVGISLAMLGLALLERPAPGRREQAGAMRERWPGALALFVGVLMLVGVPPLAGFAPKLLLLGAAWRSGALAAASVVGGITLMALAAGRLLSGALRPRAAPATHGRSDDLDQPIVPSAPGLLLVATVLLAAVAAVAGFWPLPLAAQLDGVVRTFSFLAP